MMKLQILLIYISMTYSRKITKTYHELTNITLHSQCSNYDFIQISRFFSIFSLISIFIRTFSIFMIIISIFSVDYFPLFGVISAPKSQFGAEQATLWTFLVSWRKAMRPWEKPYLAHMICLQSNKKFLRSHVIFHVFSSLQEISPFPPFSPDLVSGLSAADPPGCPGTSLTTSRF